MSYIWSFIIILSIIFSFLTGASNDIVENITDASMSSVENILTLAAMLCFWSGVLNILKNTSLMSKLSNIIKPIVKKLFKKEEVNDEIMDDIALNITSNIIGVGNAASIYSVKAVTKMQELNKNKDKPNNSMTTFILLNTASIQLIPTTILSLRAVYGSEHPIKIILPIWIVSITALIAGIIAIKILNKVVE